MRKYEDYYIKQEEWSKKVITENHLSRIKYVAGTDVAYNDKADKTIGAIVVLNAETLEVVESAYHEMHIAFPYITGLFSFREVPALLEAYKKLTIKPDLIICDAQGIAHPRKFGMACHLGLELDIPTIGCGKSRLTGKYDKENMGTQRGDTQDLILKNEIVGKVLCTRNNTNPVFISVGHLIDLNTAVDWVLKVSPKYRLPETTRQADKLVNKLLKDRLNNL